MADRSGRSAEGWGETPLSVQWAWPGAAPYAVRHAAMQDFCRQLASSYARGEAFGHPLQLGQAFLDHQLPALRKRFNESLPEAEQLTLLAGLVCCSPFDIAVHDAFGNLLGVPIYDAYGPDHLSGDLTQFYPDASDATSLLRGKFPNDFFAREPLTKLPVWHLVGGLDPLTPDEHAGPAPDDGHPYYLTDWIARDGLNCLKVKLRGDDAAWDYQRLVRVGHIAQQFGVERLTTDFNCMVQEPSYVNAILDRLQRDEPWIYEAILYVEQPFPYDMERHPIDVTSVSSRKPLLMDESADSWRHVELGRTLGWNGVALKTCKTQTGALLSLCWAKAHGMHVMVQDLTNPMLAQIPHVLLAAHAETMLGVESNAMQFYPDASAPEAQIHPGLFQRRSGVLDLSSISGPGFGYRHNEIQRTLPPADVRYEARS